MNKKNLMILTKSFLFKMTIMKTFKNNNNQFKYHLLKSILNNAIMINKLYLN